MNVNLQRWNGVIFASLVWGSFVAGCSSQTKPPAKATDVAITPTESQAHRSEAARPEAASPDQAMTDAEAAPPAEVAENQTPPATPPGIPSKPEADEVPLAKENPDKAIEPPPKPKDPKFVKTLEYAYRGLRQSGSGSPISQNLLQSLGDQIQELPVAVDDASLKWTAIEMTEIKPHPDGDEKRSMAVFKFRSPLDVPADMHWSFATPERLGEWYILPAKGTMRGFQSFRFSRNLFVPAIPLPLGSLFVFQELMEGRILPGQEYIAWYIPSETTEKQLFATIRLTAAGTRTAGKTADEIRRNMVLEPEPVEFAQTAAGLRAAFEAAGRMTTFRPIDKDGMQHVLRSVWPLIPEIQVATDSTSPVWNQVVPDIAFKFHAVRFKSTLLQAADLNWAFVIPGELIRSGIVSKIEPFQEPETYRLEVNLPIPAIANPEKNLVFLQTLAKENIAADSEHVIWFSPTEGMLPDIDVALHLSPAGATPPNDDAQSIGRAIGLDVPEIPSPERVAAAFERIRKLMSDQNVMGWQFHRLVDFTAPALPWLDSNDDTVRWNKIEMTEGTKKVAAFRVGQTESNRARVIAAVTHPQSTFGNKVIDMTKLSTTILDGQRLAWGWVLPKQLGYHHVQRRRQQGMVLPGLTLPANGEVDVDLIDKWNFEEGQPLILILVSQDQEPITVNVAGRVIADPDTEPPTDIVSAIEAMGLKVTNTPDPGGVLGQHEYPISMMRFVGEELLVTGSWNVAGTRTRGDENGSLIVWDTKTRMERVSQDFDPRFIIKALSADGSRAAAMLPYVGEVRVFEVSDPEKVIVLQPLGKEIAGDYSFSPDGKFLIGCFDGERHSPKRPCAVYVWNLENPDSSAMHQFPLGTAMRTACALPNGQIVVAGSKRSTNAEFHPKKVFRAGAENMVRDLTGMGELQFLNRETFKVEDAIQEDGAEWFDVTVSDDGSRLAALTGSGWAMVWDAKTHQPIVSIPENYGGQSLRLSADGHRMVTLAYSGTVRVWDLDAPRIIRQWPARKPEITKVAISPSGNFVAMAGQDKQVRLFSLAADRDGKSNPDEQITDSIGIQLTLLTAAEFTMGKIQLGTPIYKAPGNERDQAQEPQHNVRLTRPFYIGRHEVTVRQFRDFVDKSNYRTTAEATGKGGSHVFSSQGDFTTRPELNWKNPGFPQQDSHPVVQVSWYDAQAFCEWLSEKENARYRLPTEAEWEYACRAGTAADYYHGRGLWNAKCSNGPDEELVKAYGQFYGIITKSDGNAYTAPVGSYVPNGFGLFDLHGNVWEWCSDWFDAKYYANSPADDPQGPKEGTDRVQRGGSFLFGPSTSCWRDFGPPDQIQSQLGFRVVREIP